MRIRSVYIENRKCTLINRHSNLSNNPTARAEIEAFKQKTDELLKAWHNPVLDDGVGKDIAFLSEKKEMIAYKVLNKGQLKKYLNADW